MCSTASSERSPRRRRFALYVALVIVLVGGGTILLLRAAFGAVEASSSTVVVAVITTGPGDTDADPGPVSTQTQRRLPPTTRPLEPPRTSTTAAASTTTTPAGVTATTSTTLFAGLPLSRDPLHIPILMYHYVDATAPAGGPYAETLTIPPRAFEKQMVYLARNGYHPITFPQLALILAGGGRFPDRPVVLTFDDGGSDNYSVAFPILRAHGFVANFFVITGVVGTEGRMSWDQLREMKAAGMAIESHTVRHHDLRLLSDTRLADELTGSRAEIEAEVGVAPIALAYPAGEYDARVVAAAAKAGYVAGVTTRPGNVLDPRSAMEWPRVAVTANESRADFAAHLK